MLHLFATGNIICFQEVKDMSLTNCTCRFNCTLLSLIAAVILGVIAAFVQISGAAAVTTPFLWTALAIGIVSLWVLVGAAALVRRSAVSNCCTAVTGLLAGILGTILFSTILLTVDIVAASVLSAILVGILVFFLTLTFGNTACYVRCLTACDNA